MKTAPILRSATLGFLSCCVVGLSACGPLGGGESGGGNHKVVNAPGLKDTGSRLLQAANAYRRSSGKSSLPRHAGLEAIAQEHSEAMARSGKLGHQGVSSRYAQAESKYGFDAAAENVMRWHVKAGGGVPAMLKTWTDSSGHRKNLLGTWEATGMGIAQDELGNIWVTQLFGLKVAMPGGGHAGSGRGGPGSGSGVAEVW